jgi:hypothetical protein
LSIPQRAHTGTDPLTTSPPRAARCVLVGATTRNDGGSSSLAQQGSEDLEPLVTPFERSGSGDVVGGGGSSSSSSAVGTSKFSRQASIGGRLSEDSATSRLRGSFGAISTVWQGS